MKIERGFTLIELLVVLAVLGVLALAVMPLSQMAITAQKERELRQALWQIRDALDEYKQAVDAGRIARLTESGYPPTLAALALGAADVKGLRTGAKVFFLRRIPRDPFSPPEVPDEQTWRLRSYASPPDNPLPGTDVFDVRSSSDARALDGSLYATW